ncbi:227 kDa spindle and centromere-associated protein-like protein [Gossypium australe]|uniref:227 kDa spindle and centromere-associated protein-like protein n=1 Tax=Gossypium australe TaxID=47621 RepID=A0A5B6UXX9_9ROSI|nr:227 kDa spindle and centromere-associated protein-like protein [Gossypium australe]
MKFCIDVETLTESLYSGYGELLDMPFYLLRQFILTTQRLAQCEFAFKCDNYKKKVREYRTPRTKLTK